MEELAFSRAAARSALLGPLGVEGDFFLGVVFLDDFFFIGNFDFRLGVDPADAITSWPWSNSISRSIISSFVPFELIPAPSETWVSYLKSGCSPSV